VKVDIEGAEREYLPTPIFSVAPDFVIIELHDNYGVEDLRRDVTALVSGLICRTEASKW